MAKTARRKKAGAKAPVQRTPQRAHGRSLADFPNLNDAERKLLIAARAGKPADFGDKVPETDADKKGRTIRAGLVRFLALGGDEQNPVHEQGVFIHGAAIDGPLDLYRCTLPTDLLLLKCDITGDVTLYEASMRNLNLTGSRCAGIMSDGLNVTGSVFLREGFVARGAVRFLTAQIGGIMDCSGGKFEGVDESGNALLCDRIDVGGGVFLGDGFNARGAVRLLGARIGGDVACRDGCFGAAGNDQKNKKDETDRTPETLQEPVALNLARATVDGTLYLIGEKSRFHGGVDLTGSHIRRIVDSVSRATRRRSPDPSPQGGEPTPCFLVLDGLTYDRFGGKSDLSAEARIAFLRLQQGHDLGNGFKPQPWMQMANVLRETGHADAAREVGIAYEEARRAAGVIRSRTARLLHRIYGQLVGYGHRPMRLLKITSLVWFACAVIYENAAQNGWMAPTQSIYFQHERYDKCRPENGGNWTTCDASAPEYTTFNALIYSLDVLLPLVDLQQQDSWAPIVDKGKAPIGTPWGVPVRFVMWFEVLFGWLASLLLAAVVTGLAKRSDGSG